MCFVHNCTFFMDYCIKLLPNVLRSCCFNWFWAILSTIYMYYLNNVLINIYWFFVIYLFIYYYHHCFQSHGKIWQRVCTCHNSYHGFILVFMSVQTKLNSLKSVDPDQPAPHGNLLIRIFIIYCWVMSYVNICCLKRINQSSYIHQ